MIKIDPDKIQIIDLPRVGDPRGNLSVIEEFQHVPFKIERIYWIYDVPGGEFRGSHAFKETCELIVALSGSFDIVLNDGQKEQLFHLNRSYKGLYVPKLLWRRLENFSTNSLALILASTVYDEDDYIRNFEEFSKITH
jgi:dTDP-4-dehydrorhamnose 3,5-epimerase-like enzyme